MYLCSLYYFHAVLDQSAPRGKAIQLIDKEVMLDVSQVHKYKYGCRAWPGLGS